MGDGLLRFNSSFFHMTGSPKRCQQCSIPERCTWALEPDPELKLDMVWEALQTPPKEDKLVRHENSELGKHLAPGFPAIQRAWVR